jgi:hypothetical protein
MLNDGMSSIEVYLCIYVLYITKSMNHAFNPVKLRKGGEVPIKTGGTAVLGEKSANGKMAGLKAYAAAHSTL